MTPEFHPLANAFPLIEGEEFDALVASIKANGLREPVVLFEDMILDGRNRFRACQAADVEPVFETYRGTDPAAFVVDKNINRRHLTISQRAMIGAKLATFPPGGDVSYRAKIVEESAKVGLSTLAVNRAAELVGVSRDSIVNARRVLADGTPEEVSEVEHGTASVRTISDQIRQGANAEKRRSIKPETKRNETRQMRAEIWHQLKEVLNIITGLPHVDDAVAIMQQHDRSGFVDEKLPLAADWIGKFLNAWNNRNG